MDCASLLHGIRWILRWGGKMFICVQLKEFLSCERTRSKVLCVTMPFMLHQVTTFISIC